MHTGAALCVTAAYTLRRASACVLPLNGECVTSSNRSTRLRPSRPRAAGLLVIRCALVAITTLAIPMYIIRPFVPQAPRALALALGVRVAAPWLSALCVLV